MVSNSMSEGAKVKNRLQIVGQPGWIFIHDEMDLYLLEVFSEFIHAKI